MSDAPPTAPTPEPTSPEAPPAGPSPTAHRAQPFVDVVSRWLSGKDAPADEVSIGCLEDLRAAVIERQTAAAELTQIEQKTRELQGTLLGSQGREDGLLRVLWRIHGAAGSPDGQ